ncbi:MAG: DUF2867 domain-containing protein [Deltaproteobacteria bacterium]|nr:DUF2867 domain-containing protein [Deltaproteobacteria bacterium]
MANLEHVKKIEQLRPILSDSDYFEVKTIVGKVSMREFIASMLSYYPWWYVLLYRIRGVVARVLRLAHENPPEELPCLQSSDVSLTPGENVTFFIVRSAKDNEYWIAETPEDKHLGAHFCIVIEPLEDDLKRFHVVTAVKYKHWTGPVYFNLIRLFHHIVVWRMMKIGVKK